MPSPFPGMDPYLEGSLSMSVHTQLSAEIARQLAPKLRPGYLALTSERFVFETAENAAHVATSAGTGVATAPLFLTTIIPEAVPQVTVEIRDTANRQLVTAIEVLSPTNKRGDGREEYLAKRGRSLVST